jgi:osmoprotectant transport system permease protein
VGSVAAALMAVVLDNIIGGIQWLVENRTEIADTPRYKRNRNVVVSALAVTGIFSAYSLLPEPAVDYVVGGKGYTEQYIIAGVVEAALQDAGFNTEQRLGMGTEVVFQATANNMVDVYLEYSGTVWANRMSQEGNPGRDAVMEAVNQYLSEEHGMQNLARLGFQNLYALAMRRDRAEAMGISSINDLLPVAEGLIAAGDLEFFGRPEWARLRETYGIDFDEKLTFDTSLMYTAVAEGQVDVISAYTTDGRVAEFDLLLLEDPLNALPPYDGFLAVSAEAMNDPLFVETLSALESKITSEVMREANRLVDVEEKSVTEAVAYIREVISSL